MVLDGLTNVLANLGLGSSKADQGFYTPAVRTDDQLLNQYNTSWVAQKAIDLPADDATSKWRTTDNEQAAEIEQRTNLQRTVNTALKRARIFGGSAIFIGTDRTTLTAPMQPDERIKFLRVFDKHEVTYNKVQVGRLTTSDTPDHFQIDGQQVHRSRLAIFQGRHCPDDAVFGKSQIAAAFDAIRNSDSVASNVAELVYEAKLDVYKIPDLMQQDESKLTKRLQLAQAGKSIYNGVAVDKEEEYLQKQIQFSGLKDILMASYQIVSGAVGIPATKLLGVSLSGLNATGNNEVRDYYDTIRHIQSNKIAPALTTIDALIANEAGGEVAYQWPSLWEPSAKEQSEINQANASAVASLSQLALLTDEQLEALAINLFNGALPEVQNVF